MNAINKTQKLQTAQSTRELLQEIRNHLAGQAVGSTRDQELMEMVVQVLFCSQAKRHGLAGMTEINPRSDLRDWYRETWQTVSGLIPGIEILSKPLVVDSETLNYLHRMLHDIELVDAKDDFVGDVFETFYGNESRGQEGQFFTPRNATELLIEMIDPKPGENIIDPACGAGGFLATAARYMERYGADPSITADHLYGVDKDFKLASLSSLRLGLQLLRKTQIVCADSLSWKDMNGNRPEIADLEGKFDVVLTNPPFGSRIIAATSAVQSSFELGHKWTWDGHQRKFEIGKLAAANVPPQVLFMERSVRLLRPGGRMGVVVPESLISSSSYRHVIAWLFAHGDVEAVVGMPESLFKTSGKGGTHTKTALLVFKKATEETVQRHNTIFMAEVKYCGKDSRGRHTRLDELPTVGENWKKKSGPRRNNRLGFEVRINDLRDFVLAPRYYDPIPLKMLSDLRKTHDLVRVSDLVSEGFLEITTGHEVGAAEYGSGKVPFVRTSDISSWEIKIDPKHGVSDETYARLAKKQDVQEGDILMVRDGTYLVGQVALITSHDKRIVYQSHILKIRIKKKHAQLNPYLLLAILSSVPVQRQIQSKKFTQDIIDSLGSRVIELVLPIPRDERVRAKVTSTVRKSINDRVEARELARESKLLVAPVKSSMEEELDL